MAAGPEREEVNIRSATGLAWTLWAITLVLTALSLLLVVLNLRDPGTPIPNYWLGNAHVSYWLAPAREELDD